MHSDPEIQPSHPDPECASEMDLTGRLIGPYRLVEELGRGGFGVVFVAEQSHPIRRTVAIKVIKPGMDTRSVIARFESERQALAMMEHPNIAKVLDAGSTPEGRPYFVMELVRGPTLTRYCDAEQLSVDARVELFRQVCRAIHHAHQKGVIHRDIKPSNVLVALHEGVPVPKVIDFGIAKAIHNSSPDQTALTQISEIVGTPDYISPEQMEHGSAAVDTRSDIYGLGVLLYELLCGSTPFGFGDNAGKLGAAFWNIVLQGDTDRPSVRVQKLTAEVAQDLASRRRTQPRALVAMFSRDLDWIVMKCLERDRRLRYESAHDLDEDLGRHLGHAPVIARPPSIGYQLQKAWARHRIAFTFSATLFIALVAGSGGIVWQGYRAARERDRAVLLLDQNKLVAQMLFDMFVNLNIEHVRGGVDRLEEAWLEQLKKAAVRLNQDAVGDPLSLVDLKVRLAQAMGSLGHATEARQQLEEALAILGRLKGDHGAVRIWVLQNQGMMLQADGQLEAARNVLNHALQLAKAGGEGTRRLLGSVQQVLGSVLMDLGRVETALPLIQEAAKEVQSRPDLPHPALATAQLSLGTALTQFGNPDAAMPALREASRLFASHEGSNAPGFLRTHVNLGMTCIDLGRVDEAIQVLGDALPRCKSVLGPQHPDTIRCMINLASAHARADDLPKAMGLGEEALSVARSRMGPRHPVLVEAIANRAAILREAERPDLAIPLLEEALPLSVSLHGPTHPHTLVIRENLGCAQRDSGNPAKALTLLAETQATMEKLKGDLPDRSLLCMVELARTHLVAGDPTKAAELGAKALGMMRSRFGPKHAWTIMALQYLSMIERQRGRWEQALALEQEAFDRIRDQQSPGVRDLLASQMNLALLHHQTGRSDRAVELLGEAQRIAIAKLGATNAHVLTLTRNLRSVRIEDALRRNAWSEMAAGLEDWTRSEPDQYWLWYQLLVAGSQRGDIARHQEHAQQAVLRFEDSPDTQTAAWISKASILLPSPPGSELPVRAQRTSARLANDPNNRNWLPYLGLAHALALYRMDRAEDAARVAREILAYAGTNPVRDAQIWSVLALALQRQGGVGEARDAIRKASALLPAALLDAGTVPAGAANWHELLSARVLLREAQQAVGK